MEALIGLFFLGLMVLIPLGLFVWAWERLAKAIRDGREKNRQSREYYRLRNEHRVAIRALKIKYREELINLKAKQDKEISLIYK